MDLSIFFCVDFLEYHTLSTSLEALRSTPLPSPTSIPNAPLLGGCLLDEVHGHYRAAVTPRNGRLSSASSFCSLGKQ